MLRCRNCVFHAPVVMVAKLVGVECFISSGVTVNMLVESREDCF